MEAEVHCLMELEALHYLEEVAVEEDCFAELELVQVVGEEVEVHYFVQVVELLELVVLLVYYQLKVLLILLQHLGQIQPLRIDL